MTKMAEPNAAHVLIVSTRVEVSTDAVVRALGARGVPCTRLNAEDIPFEGSLTTKIVGSVSTRITDRLEPRKTVMLDDVSSIWYRRVRSADRPESMNPGVYDYCVRESRAALLGMLMARGDRVMSPPANVWRAEHKLVQLVAAREAGLSVPETVVTNDPDEVRAAFRQFGGQMVGKAVRSGYVDYGRTQHAIYTTQILDEHLDEVESARWSPAIYQPLIAKHCDVRVTVVGRKFFVAEIDSQKDPKAVVDWRKTEDPHLPHRRGELPNAVRFSAAKLLDDLGLQFAAIDFIRTHDERYVFLEVNPNGQWLWLDDKLDFNITREIAGWLAGEGR